MAGKKAELGFVCYVMIPGRGAVPVDALTAEERAQWGKNMRDRLSERMSDYYTQHPEELARI